MLRAAARRLSTLPLTHYKKWGSRELLILPPRFQSKAVLIQRYHISYFSAQTYSSLQSSSFQNSLPYNSEESILLTESFIKRMKELQKEDMKEDMKEEIMLRLSVESGGCSGFQYSFILDDKCNPDDRVFEKGGVKLVVDSISFEFVKGATVDFVDELIRSSFMVTLNPNAGGGCSCGSSFTVK